MTLSDATEMPLAQTLVAELPGVRINRLPKDTYERTPHKSLTCRGCYDDADADEVYVVVTEPTFEGNKGTWSVAMFRCPACGPRSLNSLSQYRPLSAIARVSTRREGPWTVVKNVREVLDTRTD